MNLPTTSELFDCGEQASLGDGSVSGRGPSNNECTASAPDHRHEDLQMELSD